MKKLEANFWKIIAIAAIVLLGLAIVVRECTTSRNEPPVYPSPAAISSEVADEIIKKNEEKAKAKEVVAVSTHENVVVPPSPETMKAPDPKLSDEIIYITGIVNFDQGSAPREVAISGIYGTQYNALMVSTVSFRKTAYKKGDLTGAIWLQVIIRAEKEENSNNYIVLDFVLHAPTDMEERWGTNIERFDSRSEGSAQFPLAYDIFREDWQKAEILHLARQVLNIALISHP